MNKNIKNSLVKIIFIVSVLILWQVLYTLKIWPEILFPSLGDIGKAFVTAFTERELGTMVLHSLSLIIKGLIVGIALALVFSSLSVISETFYTIYNMIVSMCDLIPAMHLINVDFPQPEGPRMHKKSSSFIVKSRLFKITLSELSYFFTRLLIFKTSLLIVSFPTF